MAIAIGATASVFGLVDGVLLKALPYREPDRVLAIWERNPSMQLPKLFHRARLSRAEAAGARVR